MLLRPAEFLTVKILCYVPTPSDIPGGEVCVLCSYTKKHPWQWSYCVMLLRPSDIPGNEVTFMLLRPVKFLEVALLCYVTTPRNISLLYVYVCGFRGTSLSKACTKAKLNTQKRTRIKLMHISDERPACINLRWELLNYLQSRGILTGDN